MIELDERKQKILKAIIQTYLETGEPVGSRTISKYTDLKLSSATIRNEMADLEEMGYIIQPHTSAGRIPSDKGYRLYVDQLVAEKTNDVATMNTMLIEKTDRMEKVLKQVVKMLATNTNYTTMITGPTYHKNKIQFIQLSQVSEGEVLLVIVVQGNLVRNKIIPVDGILGNDVLLKLNLMLNTTLNGMTIHDINLGVIAALKEKAGVHGPLVSDILDAMADAIGEEDEEMEIYTSGATNIFKYPELSDSQKASELISAFEEKHLLADFAREAETESDETGIRVYIGSESPVQTMKDCSVVTATYELGDGMKGTIGIIGPKRMDYENVMDNLKTLKAQLDTVFKKE